MEKLTEGVLSNEKPFTYIIELLKQKYYQVDESCIEDLIYKAVNQIIVYMKNGEEISLKTETHHLFTFYKLKEKKYKVDEIQSINNGRAKRKFFSILNKYKLKYGKKQSRKHV